jgi:hypothetical protein
MKAASARGSLRHLERSVSARAKFAPDRYFRNALRVRVSSRFSLPVGTAVFEQHERVFCSRQKGEIVKECCPIGCTDG